MITPTQHRAKALEYTELVKTAISPDEKRELRKLEDSFTAMADNEQWLEDNRQRMVHAPERAGSGDETRTAERATAEVVTAEEESLTAEEEHVLRCLGGALIMQWNTLPRTLRRELFNNAGSMGALLKTAELRRQIALFLHKHKDDEDPATI